jgi:hypothetical protein
VAGRKKVWRRKNACRILLRKSEGKRPLDRHRHRWKENISVVIG